MSYANEWERFYTDSKTGDEWLVDQIEIDVKNKRYILSIDANELITDGYDEEGEPISSYYVSRFMFDLLVSGVIAKGFQEHCC